MGFAQQRFVRQPLRLWRRVSAPTLAAVTLILLTVALTPLIWPASRSAPPSIPGALLGATAEQGLLGSYYTNRDLAGEPAVRRVDPTLDFAWSGDTSPAPDVAPPMSARWTGAIRVDSSEQYTLYTTSDDGVRLWVDGKLLIDNWTVHAASEDRASVALQAGRWHALRIEFFDRGYYGTMRLEWSSPSLARQVVPATALSPQAQPAPTAGGLRASYYAGVALAGAPQASATEGPIDRMWDDSASPIEGLAPPFSARWEGMLQAPVGGAYTLYTTSDDGVRLWVDGKLLIDNWTVHAASEDRASLSMKAGTFYPIRIEFFDRGYYGALRLEWSGPNLPRQLVPADALFSLGSAERLVGLRFTPTPLAIESPELVNPLRGLYRWMGNEHVPSPDPLPERSADSYDRYEWRDLEPSAGQYTFGPLERDLAAAAAEGRKHSFRVRVVVSGKGVSVPDYLMGLMDKGWWHDYSGDGSDDTYVPDWNNPDFMDRVGKLIAALGKKYNDDPRVGWIDIGIYGNWGEWHMHRFPYPSPSGAQNMSSANRQRLVDMYVAAFPNKRLIMPSDDERTLRYALAQSPAIGWRRDSLSVDHFEKISSDDASWELVKDRWRTAPVITEFINPTQQTYPDGYLLGKDQVERYHVSLVSNGNTRRWQNLDDASQAALLSLAKASGYRFAPSEVTLSSTLRAGAGFQIQSVWQNSGVAPAYEAWSVVFQLRAPGSGALVWEGGSGLDLQALLPTAAAGDDVAPAKTDSFALPASVAAGTYDLVLLVRDPQAYRRPLALAITGRQADGSYAIGAVRVTSP